MGAAAAPMLIGSAIGAMTSKNPLQGALMGGMLGGAGSAFMGGTSGLSSLLSGTGSTASGILPSALSGSTTINAVTPMAGQAFVNPVATSLTTGPSISANIANEASKFARPEGFGGVKGMFSGGIGSSIYTQPNLGGGPTTGMVPSSLATPPGFLDQIGNYAQQNPNLTRMGLESAQQMMQQPQAQFAPAGQIQRGGIQDVQIASALPQAPRISLI
jgi:hypothetical protein